MKKNDVKIKVNTENRQVYFNDNFLGVNAENLQSDLIFEFDGEFVNGSPRVEVELDGSKYIITEISKVGNTYVMPIKSSLLTTTQIYMQLVITESGDSEIPIFKSRRFYLIVEESINASTELPDEYEQWIDIANTKLNQVDNLNIEMQDSVVTITRKDGTQYSENVKGDSYVITTEDYQKIETNVKNDIQPTLNQNLKEAKDYTDNSIVKDFKDITFDTTTMTFVFTRHDNTTFTVDLPIEQTVKNGFYDEETKELVLVLVSNQEIRIPASGLIDDYSGVDTATIQLVISANNTITANIKAGSIEKTLLTTELQEEINGKLNSNLVEQKDLLVTYEDETTETIKLVVYK